MSIIRLTPFERPSTTILFVIVCIAGGFYCSDLVSNKIKRTWWVLNVITVLYGSFFAIPCYILTTSQIKLTNFVYSLVISVSVLYTQLFIPSVTCYYYRNIIAVLRNLDHDLSHQEPEVRPMDLEKKRYDNVSRLFYWLLGSYVFVLPLVFSNHFYVMSTSCDQSCWSNELIYIEATPFTEYVNSMSAYMIVMNIQALHAFFAIAQFSSAVPVGLIIGYKVHDVCVNLTIHLDHLVDDAISQLNLTRRAPRRNVLAAENAQLQTFKQFKNNFAVILVSYQKISKSMEIIRSWIQILCTVNIINFFVIGIPLVYIVFESGFEPLLKVKSFSSCIILASGTYSNCVLGEIFKNINDMLINEIYSTKWYELPPQYRKMIHIFQGQVRKPIQFFVFGVYPITIQTFAQSARFIYSIINVLLRLDLKF